MSAKMIFILCPFLFACFHIQILDFVTYFRQYRFMFAEYQFHSVRRSCVFIQFSIPDRILVGIQDFQNDIGRISMKLEMVRWTVWLYTVVSSIPMNSYAFFA